MSLRFDHGVFTWDTADPNGTVYTITPGFEAKAIILCIHGRVGSGEFDATMSFHGVGFISSTSSRRCMLVGSQGGAGTSNTNAIYRDDAVLGTLTSADAIDGLLDINTITSTQFTLIVDDNISISVGVLWFAFGGDDIENVAIAEITEPAATGVQSYDVANWLPTVLGNNVVFFAGLQTTTAAPAATPIAAGFMFGAATGTGAGNQFVCACNEDDASGTMDTDRYARGDECVAMIAEAGGNPNARASFNGFDATGFDLNWTARNTTDRRYMYLAIQGASWKVGNTTLDADTIGNTATVSGLAFQPFGAIHVNHGDASESTSATSQTEGIFGFGGWGGQDGITNRRANSYWSENGPTTCEINLIGGTLGEDQIIVVPTTTGTLDVGIDIDAVLSDGFRIIVDTAGAGATNFVPFVAFADSPIRPNSGEFPDLVFRKRVFTPSGMRPPTMPEP